MALSPTDDKKYVLEDGVYNLQYEQLIIENIMRGGKRIKRVESVMSNVIIFSYIHLENITVFVKVIIIKSIPESSHFSSSVH